MINGRKIREMREAEGLTIVQLAEKVCVTQPMMSYVESEVRQPSLALTERIAEYFGCLVDDLLYKSPTKENSSA